MIKSILTFLFLFLISTSSSAMVDENATTETKALYSYLQNISGESICFGQMAFNYEFNNNGSGTTSLEIEPESKIITGKYPYVLTDDYMNKATYGLSKMPDIRKNFIVQHYRNGGIVFLSWHMQNYNTDRVENPAKDDSTGASYILPGGDNRTEYTNEIATFSNWCKSLKDASGNLIPIILRIFHEGDGGWFWWGIDGTSDADYISLFRDFVGLVRDTNGVHNILYCYSPNLVNNYTYLGDRYPGDDYIDIFGIDSYSNSNNLTSVFSKYSETYNASISKNKLFVISEGMRDLSSAPRDDYWTWYFNQIFNSSYAKYASIVNVWETIWGPDSTRNDSESFLNLSYDSRFKLLSYNDTINQNNIFGTRFYVNDSINNLNILHSSIIATDNTTKGIELGTGFSTKSATFKNNVIQTAGNSSIDVPQGTTLDYNCYYDTTGSYSYIYNGTTYNSLEDYKAATGQDTHSIEGNPLINSTGFPYTNSPVIDAGTDVGVTTDYRGVSRLPMYFDDVPDIGAYERKKRQPAYTRQGANEWNATITAYRASQ